MEERVDGNFHDDDEGRSQRNASSTGLESIKSAHPGGITPMLLNKFKRLFERLSALREDSLFWQKVWSGPVIGTQKTKQKKKSYTMMTPGKRKFISKGK